jgi:hypothetical protein
MFSPCPFAKELAVAEVLFISFCALGRRTPGLPGNNCRAAPLRDSALLDRRLLQSMAPSPQALFAREHHSPWNCPTGRGVAERF